MKNNYTIIIKNNDPGNKTRSWASEVRTILKGNRNPGFMTYESRLSFYLELQLMGKNLTDKFFHYFKYEASRPAENHRQQRLSFCTKFWLKDIVNPDSLTHICIRKIVKILTPVAQIFWLCSERGDISLGSGPADPLIWITNPDAAPDPHPTWKISYSSTIF